jgi:hypothetical protein
VLSRPAILVVILMSIAAAFVGFHTGHREMDVDEVVYEQTLHAMHAGQSYYPATRDALVTKEHRAPSNVRAIRPPTVFLLLFEFPQWSWRWLTGLVMAAAIALSAMIASTFDRRAGPIAAVMTGLWMMGASALLYLHAELWGVPFLLAGVLFLIRGRVAWAAGFILAACLFRELYIAWFVALWIPHRRRASWWVAGSAMAVAFAVHFAEARRVLDPHGYQPALDGTFRHLDKLVGGFSPAASVLGFVVGITGVVAGSIALWRAARSGRIPAAPALLVAGLVLFALTIIFGRPYWGLTSGPVLATFAAVELAPLGVRVASARVAGGVRVPVH